MALMNVPGYRISETIAESGNSLVYRASRLQDGRPVVLKMLRGPNPGGARIAAFQRELEVTRAIAGEGIIEALDLFQDRNNWIMVLEDYGGVALSRLGLAGQLTLADFLERAQRITFILGYLHQHHLIHKDINPSNILCNPKTGMMKLIDFGIATRLSHQRPAFRNPGVMEGTARYISPEQTGRVNREMDYRTDFYSLGVTFYELLTGRAPFDEPDVLSLVHCHIAREPVPPEQLLPDLPDAVAQVVKKLMAKNAEDRYQSVHGLEFDLRTCQAYCLAGEWPGDFVAGAEDRPTRFEICGQLYGRERERQELMTAFQQVRGGACAFILFRGYSGLGKTSLVREAYRPITEARGYFITGKFERLQQDVPYSALNQAFRGLVKQLLTEGTAAVAEWRRRIIQAVGPNGQVLVEVIPELILLLGPQPNLPKVGPTENRNRFTRTFLSFLRIFTQKKHPLVVFLDDLQWSDAASLSFLEGLIIDERPGYLLMIGAYRGDLVDSGHPLSRSLEAITTAGFAIVQVTLSRLKKSHIAQLLGDTFVCPAEETEALADLVHTKTGGNPFFVNQFLKSLHYDGLVSFNNDDGRWRWSLSEIRARDITDNILVLMEGKIRALPKETRPILKMAGCLGNRFELVNLATVCGTSVVATAAGLWPAVEAGLVLPLSESSQQPEGDTDQIETPAYKFAHDRIQEAAYALIPEADRLALHWKVGFCLRDQRAGHNEAQLFDCLRHLNLGRVFVSGWPQRLELAELNLAAGRKAKASAAYEPALHFFETGLELLRLGADSSLHLDTADAEGEDLPPSRYKLGLALFEQAAESAYLSGELDKMETFSQQVLQEGRVLMDKIKIHEIRIQGYTTRRRYGEALASALEILASLGLQFPENPSSDDFNNAMEEVFTTLDGRDPEKLLDLPLMSDPNTQAIMRILYGAWVGTLAAFPALMPLFAARQVVISLQSGFCTESIAGFVNFGLVCCAVLSRYELGFQFDQLSRTLVERLDAPQLKPYIANIGGSCVRHWKVPLRSLFPEFRETARTALHFGDQEYSVSMMSTILVSQCSAGCNLTALDKEMAATLPIMAALKVEYAVTWTRIIWQCMQNLMGTSDQSVRLLGEAYNEDEMVPRHKATGDRNGVWLVLLHKLMLAYRFGDFLLAEKCGEELRNYPSNGSYFMPIIHFYRPLTGLVMLEHLGEDVERIEMIEADLSLMKTWAKLGAENFRHKYCLIEAEYKRFSGDFTQASQLYDQAIDLAIQNAYHNDASLACELAGRYYYSRGETRLAGYYIREALAQLARWGAAALAEKLSREFPDLLSKAEALPSSLSGMRTDSQTTVDRASSALDLASILKASQALSGEIQLERLLERLLVVVMENAGASRACLVSRQEGAWILEAERNLRDVVGGSPQIPIDQSRDLPLTVIHAAIATGEAVLLEDAGLSQLYGHDPYLLKTRARSVLCMPIHHQGGLVALLYLENDLFANAFTPDRLEVLRLLSSQTAISMENARLYQSLEQKVSDRTGELREALAREEQRHQELKQAQALLVSSEKMSSLRPLTAGIAHEINNPVCIVDATNQNLERDLDLFRTDLLEMAEGADSEIIGYLEERIKKLFTGMGRIRNGTKRIQAIVNDLRSFSRHDEAGLKMASLNGCLESTVNLVRSNFAERVEILCLFGPDIKLRCRAAQLGQVFLNILNNGYQAIRRKQAEHEEVAGRIVIRTRRRENQVEICLEDNGQGIPRSHLDKIFEPFFTTRKVGQGTGLGLTISYGIIKDHGGRIEVESVENEGTVFSIKLPTGDKPQSV